MPSSSASTSSKLKKPQPVSNVLKQDYPVQTTGLKRKQAVPVSVVAKVQKTKPATTASSSTTRKVSASTSTSAAVKKRPAWDTKGRLQDMENLTAQMKNQMNNADETISVMKDTLEQKTAEIDKLLSLREYLETHLETKTGENDEIKDKLEKVMEERDSLENKLEMKVKECDSLQSAISGHTATIYSLEAKTKLLDTQLESTKAELMAKNESFEDLMRQFEEAMERISLLDDKLRSEEAVRRQLHNTIQELKGNIRVFCRVRPPSENETISHLNFPEESDGKDIVLSMSADSADGIKTVERKYEFSFDRVFLPSSNQQQVFDEISQLVQSACDGYNVCIFAYGQTGSGKTFTMEGPTDVTEETLGMIPRAVAQIWEQTEALKSKGWQYQMDGSFIEIYNESLRDLLSEPNVKKKHEIRHLPSGETIVTDSACVKLESPAQVLELLKHASRVRQVAETQCNERSSRSHSVFTLKIHGNNEKTGENCRGILNLIDLAGSERLSQSGSTGDRLKETQAINKSLSSLGDVISALANKESHIPYRNSKLTYLLQNSLGGNSKTLMFVNVAPESKNLNETLCSLRFAKKVNNCVIGTARKVVKQ